MNLFSYLPDSPKPSLIDIFPTATNGEASKTGSSTSGASASHTTNAGSNVKMGASTAGLFGLILAAFAL